MSLLTKQSFVKNTMFNGVSLPSIYLLKEDNELKRIKSFGYQDFLNRVG
jgi:carboxynorspermidine decarboxylase